MKKKYQIGLHILVWLLIFSNRILSGYFYGDYLREIYRGLFFNYFIITLGYFSTTLLTFYFTGFIVAPAFFKKKWFNGILFTILFFVVSTAYRYFVEFYILLPVTGFHNYFGKEPGLVYYIKNNVNYVFYSNFVYGFVFYLASEWYRNNRKQKELEKEKIAAELSFLKSQINPHFLFNTLNDIYYLTYQKSDIAPEALLKLSALLRYMMKDSSDHLSMLEKEVNYLKNYIELHEIGQKGNVYVVFNIVGKIDQEKIAPLILINFIENAFKHGVIDDPLEPLKIGIQVAPGLLTFIVENKFNTSFKDSTGGIGLHNVKRRLELIYPGKHHLTIKEHNKNFNVELKIVLE